MFHLLVDQMLNVKIEMASPHALVYLTTMDHRQTVVPNARLIPTALAIKPVFVTNAKTHVLAYAAKTHTVMCSIITLFACAMMVTLEILSAAVVQYHLPLHVNNAISLHLVLFIYSN